MTSTHVPVGIIILGATVGYFGSRYFTRPKRGPFPFWGWIGLGLMVVAELLLVLKFRWVAIYFTPLAWTAYLLIIDAAVASLKGWSRIGDRPKGFLVLALLSIPLWLIFEAYNLRMQNWTYVGLPANVVLRNLGYAWSFATIWPAIFETADFVTALGFFERPVSRHRTFKPASRTIIALAGILLLTVPVLLPVHLGQYLFAPVWAGFVLLLDPLNYQWRGHSLLRDWEEGKASTFWSLIVSGLVCGILWEFWNYWAAARWIYIFPILQRWKIFEMPAPGYMGFPAFAVECFVMYEFLKVLGRCFWGLQQEKQKPEYHPSVTGSKP